MESGNSNKRKSFADFFHSIRFKLIFAVVVGGLLLTAFTLWLLTDSMTKVERNLMDSRLASDIAYLRDELGENTGAAWSIKDGALYIGDTLIGDGTLENANEDVFYHCEDITGTFYYTFVRTYNDAELIYVESGGYQQGHYKRVAGTTKGPNGESIEGTYIDKAVADVLESSLAETGKGIYGGRANVNGKMIYCRYELLIDAGNEIVGVIVVGRSIEEMEALLHMERIRGIIAVAIGLLLTCIGISVTISLMISSIGKIRERLELIGTGEYPEKPLLLKTKDELSDISGSINEMVESLKEKERIGAELSVASKIQLAMLPRVFNDISESNSFEIFATMQPAKEVGGDFYDFFMIDPDHLAIVMADVSGKGVPAALFMVIAKSLLKTCAQTGDGPAEVIRKLNCRLCENNDEDMFVTVWLGILELPTGKLTCCNAGHLHPALRRADGVYGIVENKHGAVLGWMPTMRYNEYELRLEHGDEIYIYTDGVTEAMNADSKLFGTDRMLTALNSGLGLPLDELLPVVKRHIDDFVGDAPQFDDITMLGLRYLGQGK